MQRAVGASTYRYCRSFPASGAESHHTTLSLVYTLLASDDIGVRLEHLRIRLVLLGDQPDVVLDVERGIVVSGLGLEVEQQVVLDCAGDVGLEVGVVVGVQLGRDADVVRVGNLSVGSEFH